MIKLVEIAKMGSIGANKAYDIFFHILQNYKEGSAITLDFSDAKIRTIVLFIQISSLIRFYGYKIDCVNMSESDRLSFEDELERDIYRKTFSCGCPSDFGIQNLQRLFQEYVDDKTGIFLVGVKTHKETPSLIDSYSILVEHHSVADLLNKMQSIGRAVQAKYTKKRQLRFLENTFWINGEIPTIKN
jgi:hypothetical protein